MVADENFIFEIHVFIFPWERTAAPAGFQLVALFQESIKRPFEDGPITRQREEVNTHEFQGRGPPACVDHQNQCRWQLRKELLTVHGHKFV